MVDLAALPVGAMTVDTGYYVRIERGSEWVNVDIASLTDDELIEFFRSSPDREKVERWAVHLARWIREHVVQVETGGDA